MILVSPKSPENHGFLGNNAQAVSERKGIHFGHGKCFTFHGAGPLFQWRNHKARFRILCELRLKHVYRYVMIYIICFPPVRVLLSNLVAPQWVETQEICAIWVRVAPRLSRRSCLYVEAPGKGDDKNTTKKSKNLPKQLGQPRPQEEIAQHALVSSTVRFLGPKTQRVDIFGVPILDPRWEALRTA